MATSGLFKDRLITALHTAVGYFNQDNDPNAAIVKAAKDNEFNADQTTRLVEMFNTARTLYHYKSAADRAASFSLASVDEVLPSLFSVAPACISKEAHDYTGYGERERNYHEQELMDKAAAVMPVPVDGSLTMDAVSTQAMKAVRSLRQTAKIAEDESRIASHNAARTLIKLADMFARSSNKPEMEDQYARLVLSHKDGEWAPVIDKLAEFVPVRHKASQLVMEKHARTIVFDDRDLAPHLELMKEARDWMQAEAELLAASGQFSKEADDFERSYLTELLPFFHSPVVDSLASFIRPEIVKAAQTTSETKYKTTNLYGEPVDISTKKQYGDDGKPQPGITDSIGGLMAEGAKKPVTDFLNTGIERAFTEPVARENKALSERLKNVQRQIMLQDLLVNDPVLAEEAPETVAEAYNAILQLVPEVAGNKEVVRAVLRQTVHSVAVSPYDAEIWTKLEQNLRNIRGIGKAAPEQGQGGGAHK